MAEQEHRSRPSDREVALARHFVRLADSLVADYDVADLLSSLSSTCAELLQVSAAGMLLLSPAGALRLVASSSEELKLLELNAIQSEEGPCLDCVRSGEPVNVGDIEAESVRWPRFSRAAASLGFRAVHALPLRLRTDVIGSLNLFGRKPGALTGAELQIAQALADVATIAVLQQRVTRRSTELAEQLQHALDSRIVIEQAKGLLAAHASLDMDHAFAALRQYARSHHLSLSSAAQELVSGSVTPTALLDAVR